ncbi:DUF4123 domain-containing protein [Pseudomonas sp. PDM18]|uniref:DUF4123 domain-containing protein n=1 Tax=unclassified Pseudomonas TaxID=196821 RepID=UPI00177CCEEA|nr:DUF4123 domain-containing protein [Pseudomonas sp. PDM18]MBD9676068.1 DUF4123 domain-containing protein [Pseudomonas sp. PDM18]
MNTLPNESGCLLFDGARYPDVFAWLKRHWAMHKAYPLFYETSYDAIADTGPILLAAPVGERVHEAWKQGSDFPDALWLETTAAVEDLWQHLQRRLRVSAPDGRELWLRLGDALPLRHAWQAGALWPEGFWHQVSRVWALHEQQPVCLWHNPTPDLDAAPKTTGLSAQITLDWPLLRALGANPVLPE